MQVEKKIFCRKCGSVHMLNERCYGGQTDSVYQESGLTIDTRPQYPDRVEGNKQLEANYATNNVVAESMGPGYPEVVRGAPQMESSSRNPVITSTHDEVAVKNDLTIFQSGKSYQDNGFKIVAPPSGGTFQMSYPQIKDLLLRFLGERPIVLMGPNAPVEPCLSLQTIPRHYQAVMAIWTK